jgi:hypothetical protein
MFAAVDESKWALVRESVNREYGMQIDSERGEQSQRGFTLEWTYEPGAQTLRIQCTGKPFIVPCGVVNKRISDLAADLGIQPA